MGGKLSRNKGAAWEREVAKMLRAAGVEAKRGLGQARSASEVADVEVPGWWVECKVGGPAAYPLRALAQAAAASAAAPIAAAGARLVAVCKQDRRPPVATFVADVFGVSMVVTVALEEWIRLVAAQQRGSHEP